MIGTFVSRVKKLYERQSTTSWYYRTTEQNTQLGKELAEHYRAIAVSSEIGSAQNDSASLPSPLNEARQAYENQVIMSVQRFTAEIEQPKRRLSELSERGISNLSLLRADLFYYLSVLAKLHRFWWIVWPLFILGMVLLAALDFAPTTLIFQSLMTNDQIDVGAAFGIAPEAARSYILLGSTIAFLVIIVSIGHVVSKLVASAYLDGEVPVIGWILAMIIVVVFVVISGVRFVHERGTAKADYKSYVMDLEKKAMTDSLTEKPVSEQEYIDGHFWRSAFNSGVFVLISVMIFIAAIYLSLWRVYGDIRMIVRRHKHIKYRIRCAGLDATMQAAYNVFHNEWENLRQSAQMEIEQVHNGVHLAMTENRAVFGDDNTHQRMQSLIHRISSRFTEMLRLPGSYDENSKVWMPRTEEEWGLRHSTFFTETALYEAFSKGALDGMNHGVNIPNSVLDAVAVVTSDPKYSGAHHPAISTLELATQYEAGFMEGCQVPHGAGWLKTKNLRV